MTTNEEPFPSMGKGRDGVDPPAQVRREPNGVVDPAPTPALLFEHDRHRAGAVDRARRLRSDMTVSEKRLWSELRKLGLRIRRQAPIGRFVVDFAHHGSRIVFEVDGPWHDFDDAREKDAGRDAWLRRQGYRVIRLSDGDVLRDAAGVAQRVESVILRTLAGRGARSISADPGPFGDDGESTPTPAPPPLRGRGSRGVT
jgi:very-short-patch-repair endonuclease